jgi:hypothetical protein
MFPTLECFFYIVFSMEEQKGDLLAGCKEHEFQEVLNNKDVWGLST